MIDIESYFVKENLSLHYFNRYVKFITNIYNKGKRDLDYKERHHIIPKCINEELYKAKNNIVILTAREHYIAHKILANCYKPETYYWYKLVHALFCMVNLKMCTHKRDFIVTSKEYAILRQKYSKTMRIIQSKRIGSGKWDKFIGKGEPSPNKGKIWITDGINNAYINKHDIIPDGWRKGATQIRDKENDSKRLKEAWVKNKENRVGKNHPMYGKGYLLKGSKNGIYGRHRKYVNKDGVNKLIFIEDLNLYVTNGWGLGRVVTEKSIFVYKYDTVKKIKISELALYLDKGWLRGNPKNSHTGTKNGMYGKKWINNGRINKLVDKNSVNLYLKGEWKLGLLHYK